MSVTVRGKNLEHTIVNGQDTDIESSTSEIKDKDVLLSSFLVQTIGDSCGGRLVDDPGNVQASDDTSVLGRLSLSIIEVRCSNDNTRNSHLSPW